MSKDLLKEAQQERQNDTEYDIDPIFLQRWSPRAMTGEQITERDLMTLFEAARWAPSSYNNQPWRFIYALKQDDAWESLFNLLNVQNKAWVENAAALVLICSEKIFEKTGKSSRTHSFDTGSAWENLALQGAKKEWVVHGMEGFDYDLARIRLKIPEDFDIEAMIAIGVPGGKEFLDDEKLKKAEKPSHRKALSELVFRGHFGNSALRVTEH